MMKLLRNYENMSYFDSYYDETLAVKVIYVSGHTSEEFIRSSICTLSCVKSITVTMWSKLSMRKKAAQEAITVQANSRVWFHASGKMQFFPKGERMKYAGSWHCVLVSMAKRFLQRNYN